VRGLDRDPGRRGRGVHGWGCPAGELGGWSKPGTQGTVWMAA
jgi:hypothetical protein